MVYPLSQAGENVGATGTHVIFIEQTVGACVMFRVVRRERPRTKDWKSRASSASPAGREPGGDQRQHREPEEQERVLRMAHRQVHDGNDHEHHRSGYRDDGQRPDSEGNLGVGHRRTVVRSSAETSNRADEQHVDDRPLRALDSKETRYAGQRPVGRMTLTTGWSVDVWEREEDVVGGLVDCDGSGVLGESVSTYLD